MINLNKHRIDFGKGDVGIGVIGNTTDSAQLAFYNQSARPIHILKNPDQNPGFEPMEFKEEPFIMSFSNPESIDAVISILQRAKYINFTSKSEQKKQNRLMMHLIKNGCLFSNEQAAISHVIL